MTRGAHEREMLARRSPARAADDKESIYSDPTYIANAHTMIRNGPRIVAVGAVSTAHFRDCVAVGGDNNWRCSGTLVAPNIVVTAAHCVKLRCATRVFVGANVDKPRAGTVIRVLRAVIHPDYSAKKRTYDLAVLVLTRNVDVTPRRIAGRAAAEKAPSVRVVGYGHRDVHATRGRGVRGVVEVPLASPRRIFGADASIEFVAGAPFLDRDSCDGDSGGPAYVAVKGGWAVAGVTSRPTRSSLRPCGDGGIYTKLHPFADWIRSVPGGHWKNLTGSPNLCGGTR